MRSVVTGATVFIGSTPVDCRLAEGHHNHQRANRALFEVFDHRSAPLRHARGAQPIRVVPRDIVINAKTLRAVCQRRGGLLGALPAV